MLFRYTNEKGESIEIVPESFTPLPYAELVSECSKEKLYPIEIIASSIKLPNRDEAVRHKTVSCPISFRQPVTVFGLVEGGWLPAPFVIPPRYLVDRNVISSLVRMRQDATRPDTAPTRWWFKFFDDDSLVFNPVLHAIEGSSQRVPSFDEFCRAFEEGSAEIKNHFPNSTLIQYEAIHYRRVYSIITDVQARQHREIEFLVKTANKVVDRVVDSRLIATESEILRTATDLDLKVTSVVVIAVLSCLYENPDGSGYKAARQIIKPRRQYTPQNAYNALSDLRALEFFIHTLRMGPERFALCTCDKGLAAFWCGLNLHRAAWNSDGTFTFSVSLTEHLFPRLNGARREALAQRVAAS